VQTALAALLAKRDYAAGEARAKLIERGANPDDAAAVIADFTARGYLNDARFAEKYVSYAARRGQGPARIARELRERGVAAALITEALASGPDWRKLCDDLRRRRFGAAAPKVWADKAKQARFLQYRGFSSDHIKFHSGLDDDTPQDE
jgi:regulatory protein